MATIIKGFPDKPRHIQQVELDGELFILRFTWKERLKGWFFSLFTDEREPIFLERRLSPGYMPTKHLDVGPPGEFIVRGPSNYTQKTLGEELQLRYYSESEVSELEPERTFTIR